MSPLLFDLALGLHGLVGPDVVVGKRLVDYLEPHLDSHLVRRGTVLAEQELQHEHRNVGAHLNLPNQVLAHHLAVEHSGKFVVKLVAGHCLCLRHVDHTFY